MTEKITVYGIMTCDQCQLTKEYFETRQIPFTFVNVDLLVGQERNEVMAILTKAAMFPSFPTIRIGDKFLVGFDKAALDAAVETGRAE